MTFSGECLLECRHKIKRAKEHCRTLYYEIRRFLDSQPYSVVGEYNCEEATYFLKLKISKPIPQARFAVIIGDCVHNARSSLDYLAWRLAGSKLTDRDTFFPIYETETGFDKNVIQRRKLNERIHHDALVEIRKCQPYTRPPANTDHLWFLQELDARDKHKLLTMTQTMSHTVQVKYTARGRAGEIVWLDNDVRLDNDTVVAKVKFPIGTQQSDVKVDGHPLLDIAFERGILDGDRLYPVSTYVSKIIKRVDDTIIQFERLLNEHPDWIS